MFDFTFYMFMDMLCIPYLSRNSYCFSVYERDDRVYEMSMHLHQFNGKYYLVCIEGPGDIYADDLTNDKKLRVEIFRFRGGEMKRHVTFKKKIRFDYTLHSFSSRGSIRHYRRYVELSREELSAAIDLQIMRIQRSFNFSYT